MKGKSYTTILDLHAWSGVLISWILYAVFVTGAFSLYLGATKLWEHPTLRDQGDINNAPDISLAPLLNNALEQLGDPSLEHVFIVPPSEHNPRYELHFIGPDQKDIELAYDLNGTPTVSPDNSHPIELLFELHWQLLMGTPGKYIAGFAAFFMLLAIISGLLIHWRRLWRDLFKLRSNKKPRRYWIDVHNVLGVAGLPFQLMIAFTGAFFNLLFIYQVTVGLVVFQGDQDKLLRTVEMDQLVHEYRGEPSDHAQLDAVYDNFQARHPDLNIRALRLDNLGDTSAAVTLFVNESTGIQPTGRYTYRIDDHELLKAIPTDSDNPVKIMADTIARLHFGDFGGPFLRAAYFILSLATAVVIVSGIVIWLQKRPQEIRGNNKFNQTLTRTSLGFFIGLWAACAVLFLTCHLLPEQVADRSELQRTLFLSTWFTFVTAGWLPLSTKACIRWMSLSTALLCFLIPVVQGLNTDDWIWTAPTKGEWSLAALELAAIATGTVFILLGLSQRSSRIQSTEQSTIPGRTVIDAS